MGFSNRINVEESIIEEPPKKKTTKSLPKTISKKKESMDLQIVEAMIKVKIQMLLDEFKQLETYFRTGTRPSQTQAIETIKKHIMELPEVFTHEDT